MFFSFQIHGRFVSVVGYVVIPFTEENLRAVSMEEDSGAEIEVDAYLSGSVVKALTQAAENEVTDLNSKLTNTDVEIQAGAEDFKVQCQNIGKGPDGVLRMCVLDNGEVISSLKSQIDPYSTSEILNNGLESVYEDNSEPSLDIASESIQEAQFLENAVSKDAIVSTIQESEVRDFASESVLPNKEHDDDPLSCLSDANVAADILQDLELAKFGEHAVSDQFFMPDFETLLWNENQLHESTVPVPLTEPTAPASAESQPNEYIDIGDFAFLLKNDKKDRNLDKKEIEAKAPCMCNKEISKETTSEANGCSKSVTMSEELKEMLGSCSNGDTKTTNPVPDPTKESCRKAKSNSEKSCCVTVCLNTLKQLRKVIEQRCCMAGKTIV